MSSLTRTEARTGTDAALALGILVLGLLLVLAGAGLLDQWRQSSARHQAVTVEDLLGAAATVAGAGLLLWWFVSLACAAATLLLEKFGRARAAAATRKLSPAFMRRLVVATVSFHLLAGGAANAATPAPGPHWTPTLGQESAAPANPAESPRQDPSPTPDLPSSLPGAAAEPSAAAPDTALPDTAALPVPPATIHPGWQPSAPVVEPALLAGPAARDANAGHGATAGRPMGSVAVLAGDSLWDIVASHLGPEASDVEIALEWPRWYEANKTLIGQNPDVLLPGQVLLPPAAS